VCVFAETNLESWTKGDEGLHVGAVIAQNIIPCQQGVLIFNMDLKKEVQHPSYRYKQWFQNFN